MTKITRRNFLNITAVSIALSMFPNKLSASQKKVSWEGFALGAQSKMSLFHKDINYAKDTLKECEKEIYRLENIFSLFIKDSIINKLNNQSYLKNPPRELIEVLNFSREISKNSKGAFDITVQPLWEIHAKYFNDKKLLEKKIKKSKKLIAWDKIRISKNRIHFKQKGMAITLNGIAQGYITDKISELLRKKGFTNVLVDLGEINTIGQHPNNRDWNISTPYLKDKKYLQINNQAMASSGGYGTSFNRKLHHLFNPKSGTSANYVKSVTVVAQTAMLADALSTAIAVMPKNKSKNLIKLYPNVRVYTS